MRLENVLLGQQGLSVKVYFNYIDREWVVRKFKNNQAMVAANYFTDDKQDAMQTAAAMLQEAKLSRCASCGKNYKSKHGCIEKHPS